MQERDRRPVWLYKKSQDWLKVELNGSFGMKWFAGNKKKGIVYIHDGARPFIDEGIIERA